MRKITKGQEPLELSAWKRNNRKKVHYADLSHIERLAIKQSAIQEQYALCAYCCKLINLENSVNEHLDARHHAHSRELDFANIVASCNTRDQCDDKHGSQHLPLTPLMDECETELSFALTGKVIGQSERATESIRVLGLDRRILIETRKQMMDTLLYQMGTQSDDLQLLEDEFLLDILSDLKQPQDNKLLPYSPVLVNILHKMLTSRVTN